jgi:hypothetical protein
MLTIAAFINERIIARIDIVNAIKKNAKGDFLYHANISGSTKPKISVWHKREDGWGILAIKVLRKLMRQG